MCHLVLRYQKRKRHPKSSDSGDLREIVRALVGNIHPEKGADHGYTQTV